MIKRSVTSFADLDKSYQTCNKIEFLVDDDIQGILIFCYS
jgi:hypothetical protein